MLQLSVIIATRNRCESLKRVIKNLLEQEVDGLFEFELVVVDNNSSDMTRQEVESFVPLFGKRLSYLFESQPGKSYALNHGIRESRGEVLVFTDDDVVIDPHWLSQIVKCFRQYSCDGVGGKVLPIYPPKTPQWVKKNALLLSGLIGLYDYGEDSRPYQKSFYEFPGVNFALKRTVFEDCGLFRTDIGAGKAIMGEDTELIGRVFKAGKNLYYCGKAILWHPVAKRPTLKYIAQWNIALGRYRMIVDEKREIDPGLVYYFGVPRYLIRQIVSKACGAVINIFDRKKFLEAWVLLFRDWGKATEIRKISQEKIWSFLPRTSTDMSTRGEG